MTSVNIFFCKSLKNYGILFIQKPKSNSYIHTEISRSNEKILDNIVLLMGYF